LTFSLRLSFAIFGSSASSVGIFKALSVKSSTLYDSSAATFFLFFLSFLITFSFAVSDYSS